MRARLDAMGPVNMMALEEYKETAERHQFLGTQRKDLLDAIENTAATIREIDQVSRQKFEEAFNKINENFQATFRKLFGGGHGFMRLTDLENSAESGIDVVASPPGKKLQNVLLLSGGEKALTALALLVGIFQYTPSPFCILDEVDAPLDEANIARFTELVREMSVQTQFILITHSKRTMSIAPVLYGVTMQEPGVSKLVSVQVRGGVERGDRHLAVLASRRSPTESQLMYNVYIMPESSVLTLRLDAKLKNQLDRLSKSMNRSRSFVAAQAIQEYVSVNEWQIAEIKKGLAEADAGDFASEEEVQQVLKRWTRRAR